MSSPADDIIAENDRLFAKFTVKLASPDMSVFVPHIHKISMWLGDARAYYPQARPKIIDIMEVARSNLLRQVGSQNQDRVFHVSECPPQMKPWVDAYILLVRTVATYRDKFNEPSILGRLHMLLYSISWPAANQVLVAHTPPHIERKQNPKSSPTIESRVPESQQSSEALESSIAAQPVTAVLSSAAPAAPTTKKPKKSKKDKRGDDMAFLEEDLIHFKAKKTLTQPSSPKQYQISAETDTLASAWEPSARQPSPPLESPPKDVISPPATTLSASTSPQDNPTTEKLSKPQVQPQVTPQTDVNGADVNGYSEVPATLEQENCDSTKQISQTSDCATDANVALNLRDPNHGSSSPNSGVVENTADRETAMDVDVDGQEERVQLSHNANEHISPVMSYAHSDVAQNQATTSALSTDGSTGVELAQAEDVISTNLQEDVLMEVSTVTETSGNFEAHEAGISQMSKHADVDAAVGENNNLANIPLGLPDDSELSRVSAREPQGVVPSLGFDNDTNKSISSDASQGPVKLRSEHSEEPKLIEGELAVTLRAPMQPHLDEIIYPAMFEHGMQSTPIEFGSEMVVVSCHQGDGAGKTIEFQFTIQEDAMRFVTTWKERDSKSDVSQSVLLTLGCYLSTDIMEALNGSSQTPTISTKPFLGKPCIWPQSNNVSMGVQYESTPHAIPLAPPCLQLTPDGLVDLSPFLEIGRNTIQIHHSQDMHAYTFFICAHHPTRAQMADVERKKKLRKRWLETMTECIEKPWSVPVEPWSEGRCKVS